MVITETSIRKIVISTGGDKAVKIDFFLQRKRIFNLKKIKSTFKWFSKRNI